MSQTIVYGSGYTTISKCLAASAKLDLSRTKAHEYRNKLPPLKVLRGRILSNLPLTTWAVSNLEKPKEQRSKGVPSGFLLGPGLVSST
ncbi:Hypothetical protein NTJ_01625 [Nesidiocoris tenuis]|uniref:Uncharacterized protein n=1 Tax=Nesidiocoris tenuis TaxID=355587 RepID=A0ABN7A9Z0_9HEMI|nr:Hypothetical protein NTJ_01625 [Nesidiocoris tenuis]